MQAYALRLRLGRQLVNLFPVAQLTKILIYIYGVDGRVVYLWDREGTQTPRGINSNDRVQGYTYSSGTPILRQLCHTPIDVVLAQTIWSNIFLLTMLIPSFLLLFLVTKADLYGLTSDSLEKKSGYIPPSFCYCKSFSLPET